MTKYNGRDEFLMRREDKEGHYRIIVKQVLDEDEYICEFIDWEWNLLYKKIVNNEFLDNCLPTKVRSNLLNEDIMSYQNRKYC